MRGARPRGWWNAGDYNAQKSALARVIGYREGKGKWLYDLLGVMGALGRHLRASHRATTVRAATLLSTDVERREAFLACLALDTSRSAANTRALVLSWVLPPARPLTPEQREERRRAAVERSRRIREAKVRGKLAEWERALATAKRKCSEYKRKVRELEARKRRREKQSAPA